MSLQCVKYSINLKDLTPESLEPLFPWDSELPKWYAIPTINIIGSGVYFTRTVFETRYLKIIILHSFP
jgi:hypothetical protein